jgi:DNA-binding transcriptional ArsR family regulator
LSACPTIPKQNYAIPISSSILPHCKQIGNAIWTFLWMIDHTTRIRAYPGGLEGLVSNGDKVKVELIAEALGLSPHVIRGHIRVLQKAGLVRKMVPGIPSGFALAADYVKERAR